MSGFTRRPTGAAPAPRRMMAVAAVLVVAVVASGCSSSGKAAGRPSERPTPAATLGESSSPPLQGGLNPLGANFDRKRLDSFAPYLRTLSGGATFDELVWCDVEPKPGALDWSSTDKVVEQTKGLGLTQLMKIRVGSCWATGGMGQHVRGAKQRTESLMPQDLGAYERFVAAAVERYAGKGVHEYAIENEINGVAMWGATPEDYVRLVTVAARAIRASDPSARVVDPGISSTAYGVAIADRLLSQGRDGEAVQAYQHYYARRTTRNSDFPAVTDANGLRSALRSDQGSRNLAFLAAVNRLAAEHVVDVRQLHFYEQWDNVPALLDYLRASLPASFPVEAWEVGMFWQHGTTDGQVRAAEVTKTVSLLLAGGVRRVIWLPLAFNPDGRHADEPRYGLLDSNGAVRPAGKALVALATATRGASMQSLERAGVHGVAFGHPQSSTLVFWSDKGATLPRAAPGGAIAEQLGGDRLPWDSAGLRVGTQPLVVVVPQPLSNAVSMVLG